MASSVENAIAIALAGFLEDAKEAKEFCDSSSLDEASRASVQETVQQALAVFVALPTTIAGCRQVQDALKLIRGRRHGAL